MTLKMNLKKLHLLIIQALHKTAFFFFSFILLLGCNSNNNCHNFKTGTFTYREELNNDIVIQRTENQQIETSEKLNFTEVYNIYWTSDCSYFLVLQSTNQPEESIQPLIDTMYVNITQTTDNNYSFNAALNNKKYTGKLIKQL